ncbi:hypothetical protein DV711_16010 [Motiliproteus coralliicola]|uniref:Oxidoreductase molybdopterin-binding domain-containing protein n=1 Tax=Motiliproteus coralliicola TaxID=2283196 RepID=A0A369WCQ8_9GAMM|nr:molybdopterin-dependent oxidoreductase [Motiliproteus coralliicola]RDE19093.1 hypothetical protein DV711_16010 [Motiliproteus coralliicola]
MQKGLRLLLLSILIGPLAAVGSQATPLEQPTGDVLLTVTGAIENTNAPGQARFDRAMLEALPQHSFDTITPWTDGKHQYEGVLLKELLQQLGAKGSKVVAHALNDYHSVIDLDPIRNYPVMIAIRADGKPMRIRDKGPLWILYPMSDYPELNHQRHHPAMVWQLNRLEVQP